MKSKMNLKHSDDMCHDTSTPSAHLETVTNNSSKVQRQITMWSLPLSLRSLWLGFEYESSDRLHVSGGCDSSLTTSTHFHVRVY